MSKKLEKWWLEWDPRNEWLQVGGHVRLADGHYDEWLTSPIESALGPLVVKTISKTQYELGTPAKVDKWLVPHKIKKLFYPNGFTEQWADELKRVKMTRHTPHRDRPVTPIDEMMAMDVHPIAENVSIASTVAKEPPKRGRAPKQAVQAKAKPVKASTVKASKPKKRTKTAPSDPLAMLTKQKMMPLSAKFNYQEDADSSDIESDAYQPTPQKVRKPRRTATTTKQPKVTKKKAPPKKRTRTQPKEDQTEHDTVETVLSPPKKAKTMKKKVDNKNSDTITVKLPAKKNQTKKTRGRPKKTVEPEDDNVSIASTTAKEPPKRVAKAKTKATKPKKQKAEKKSEKVDSSFALSASPIPTPVLKKKSTQAQARQNIKLKQAAQVPYQFETPQRKNKKTDAGFATPSHSKPNTSSDFRTPKASTNSQTINANIGYKTPVLSDANGRPKKKGGFKTPKLGITAEANKIKARNIKAKQAPTKSSFKTPKKTAASRKRSAPDDITAGMSVDVEDDDEEVENYFENY